MKQKLTILGLILSLLAVPLLAACAQEAPTPVPAPVPTPVPTSKPPTPAPVPPSEDVYTLTMAIRAGKDYISSMYSPPWFRFQEMVETRSNGRLKIDSKLDIIPIQDTPLAVSEGRFDMGMFYMNWFTGTWPEWSFQDIPFLWGRVPNGLIEYLRAVKDPRLFAIMQESFGNANMELLAIQPKHTGSSIRWGMGPLRTVDDFKDVKIRANSQMVAWMLEALGAKAITLQFKSFAEVPEWLARGTVDQLVADRTWAYSISVGDIATHINEWPLSTVFGTACVVNKDKWEELPPDLQQVLVDVAWDTADQVAYSAYVGAELIKMAAEYQGIEYIMPSEAEVSKARELVRPLRQKWIDLAAPYGEEIAKIAAEYASGA